MQTPRGRPPLPASEWRRRLHNLRQVVDRLREENTHLRAQLAAHRAPDRPLLLLDPETCLGVEAVRTFPDGRRLEVWLMTDHTIRLYELGHGWVNSWDYPTREAALAALERHDPRDR